MKARFRMGGLFPSDDVVARFVITLAMYTNDLFRSTSWFRAAEDIPDAEVHGRRYMVMRYQLGMLHELGTFLSDARRIPEISDFIASLPDGAAFGPDKVAKLVAELGPWVGDLRNITFHYAEMHPARIAAGKDEVMIALSNVAQVESEIVADASVETGSTAGFPFADVVVAEWLRSDFAAAKPELLVAAITSAGDFSMAAVRGFLVRQGKDALLSIEP
jgi:hypothetical protein